MENLKKFIQEEIQKLHQITLLENKKKQIEDKLQMLNETKDVKSMYRKAGMTPPDGKGIHTKKFHKCVTSVGDEGGKNPYAICMSSLGKEKAVKSSHRTDENMEYPVSDTKSKILSQAGEMPETGVDLRFNMHDEPYILKTLDNEEVNAWISAVKNVIPDILVYKHKSMKAEEPTLNEEYMNSLEMAAKKFIKNVLKLETKENLFDAFMLENGIERDNLRDFIDTVGYMLQNGRWW